VGVTLTLTLRRLTPWTPTHPLRVHSVIAEQILLRDNAVAQADLLVEYKRLFVRHASHHHAFRHPPGGTAAGTSPGAGGRGLLSVFAGLLAEPLAKTGSARTAEDHLAIELVLHLIRNLLAIAPLNTFGSVAKSQVSDRGRRDGGRRRGERG
jgi:hypothetical protein